MSVSPEVFPTNIFGVNAHIGYGWPGYSSQTVASYLAYAKDLGIGWWRTSLPSNDAPGALFVAPYLESLRASGIETMVVLTGAPSWTSTYGAAYATAYPLGVNIGTALAGFCQYFETSNELDFLCRTDGGAGALRTLALNGVQDGTYVDGSIRGDFDPVRIEAFCGWNTGMADGIRSQIPDALIGTASGVGYGYVMGEMWQKGLDRNGNIVRPVCNVNFQSLHWYDGQGDPRNAGQGTAKVDIFEQTISRMNCPTIISEWGSTQADAGQGSWLTLMGTEWYTYRKASRIIGNMWYALFPNSGDGTVNNWGIMQADGTHKSAYAALKTCATTMQG